ncbi:MAG: SDR family oxidoreductase [Proteobacteria bacterium]|nr:SDR family oxidoreductase [Pseudomonadota bacterium]
MEFKGKAALVTGAGGGMGFRIAHDLLTEGADVTMVDVKADPDDWPGGGGSGRYVQGDLTDAPFIERMVDEAFEAYGRLDCVVNVAGLALVGVDTSVLEMDLAIWEKIMKINLMAPVLITRRAVPHMRRSGGGALVHIASVVGCRSMDNTMKDGPMDAYQVSKAGLISLSRSLAITLGGDKIRSNTICPGAVRTPMTEIYYQRPERVSAMEERTPLHRIGTPEDIANATLFLLSDKATFITGTDIVVDGGLLAKLE